MVPKDTTLTTEDSYSELATLTFLCTRAWSVPERAVPAPVSPVGLSILISVSAAVQKKQIAKEKLLSFSRDLCVCVYGLVNNIPSCHYEKQGLETLFAGSGVGVWKEEP